MSVAIVALYRGTDDQTIRVSSSPTMNEWDTLSLLEDGLRVMKASLGVENGDFVDEADG